MDSLLKTLDDRGFIVQCTGDFLADKLKKEKVTIYAGFDATADSLHLGHLIPIMALSYFQKAGHRVLLLVGGATGMVGDPSGKSAERNLLTPEQVTINAQKIKEQMSTFLNFSDDNPAEILNNHDWISKMTFIDWLRDVGKYFSINNMLNKESVRRRTSSLLSANDISDWPALCSALDTPADPLTARFQQFLPPKTKQTIKTACQTNIVKDSYKAAITRSLNDIIKRRDFYTPESFADVTLTEECKKLASQNTTELTSSDLERLNRSFLEIAFPKAVLPNTASKEGISYTEFSYMTMQAYDFLYLYENYNCTVEGGGTDQWGNIIAGKELIRKVHGADVGAVTFPLVTTSTGEKFGKTAGNAVWIDPKRTSPYEFYQYWISSDDRDVENYLNLFTFLELGEIRKTIAAHKESPEKRLAQKTLAAEMTRLIHGPEALDKAIKASKVLFGEEITGLSDADLTDIFADVPSTELPKQTLDSAPALTDILCQVNLCGSKGQAKKTIKAGGIYLNNLRVTDIAKTLTTADLASETMLVLRSGKKKYHLLKFTQ